MGASLSAQNSYMVATVVLACVVGFISIVLMITCCCCCRLQRKLSQLTTYSVSSGGGGGVTNHTMSYPVYGVVGPSATTAGEPHCAQCQSKVPCGCRVQGQIDNWMPAYTDSVPMKSPCNPYSLEPVYSRLTTSKDFGRLVLNAPCPPFSSSSSSSSCGPALNVTSAKVVTSSIIGPAVKSGGCSMTCKPAQTTLNVQSLNTRSSNTGLTSLNIGSSNNGMASLNGGLCNNTSTSVNMGSSSNNIMMTPLNMGSSNNAMTSSTGVGQFVLESSTLVR